MGAGQFSAQRYETLGRSSATTYSPTTVTSDAAANTKGTYATIGTTTFAWSGFYLRGAGNLYSARFRFDVAANTGGSDVIIVQDYFVDANASQGFTIWCPLRVPSGAAVKIRCQDSTGAATMTFVIDGYTSGPNGPPSYSRIISCTDFTNTDATNGNTLNGTTQTAWAEVEASTALRVAALYVSTSDRNDAARTTVNILADIGWGAGGSERVFANLVVTNNGNTNYESANYSIGHPLWCDFPAGTRLAVRSVASAACTDAFGICLMGLVP